MQAQQAPLIFTEAERPLGERLLKLALETDRVEGYTEPHAVMIARLAEAIGAQMGVHGVDLSALKFAALAHDIGERGMKRNYLLQPNSLTWEETLDLWRHPILGEQSAADMRLPRQSQLLIRWHHEWWNGQGYPDGLTGLAIPLGARILRAVDTYCALISRRPHRQNFELLDAEQIIADLAGIEFDPQIVKRLLAIVVTERKQREAESWRATPIVEPAFDWRSVPLAEEAPVPSQASEFEPEPVAPPPAHPPEADTLEMAAVVVEAPMPIETTAEEQFSFANLESEVNANEPEQPTVSTDSQDLPAAMITAAPAEILPEAGSAALVAEPPQAEPDDAVAEQSGTPEPSHTPGEDEPSARPTPIAEDEQDSAPKI